MADELKHYGVKGMRWGHRRAKLESLGRGVKAVGSAVGNLVVSKAGREAFKRDVETGKKVANAIMNNKAFKAMIFNKDAGIFTKEGRAEIRESHMRPLRKVKAAASRIGGKIADGMHRSQIRAQDRDIALFKGIVDGYKNLEKRGPLSKRDKKIKDEHEKAIKDLEEELNFLYTPEELKKYRS